MIRMPINHLLVVILQSGDEGSSPQVIDGDFDDKEDSDCDEDYEISSLEK